MNKYKTYKNCLKYIGISVGIFVILTLGAVALSDKITGVPIHHEEWGYENFNDYKVKIEDRD